ncbi:MAG: hypothetical protein PHU92_03445, partial [Candidatus Shapirobacteria bacterium]|nr:hypothetical protein [Candidatus Shapirobacteria bacterium]
AEEGNEAFLVYPVDVLASQYKYGFGYDRMNFIHHANDRDFRRLGMDNDVFVWPGTLDNPGIPVDSGIVFLPKNSLVDPETGSIYASETTTINGQEARVRLKTESVEEKFQAYIVSQGEPKGYFFNKTSRELLEEFSPDLLASMDFSDDAIWRFRRAIYNGFTPEQAFGRANAAWQRAQNPISSQEYWENYFRQNPQIAPKHVYYYDNHTGSGDAVSGLLQRNNIGRADTSDTEGELLGFDENNIPNKVWRRGWGAEITGQKGDNDAWLGYDQLEETMLQIASRRMGQQS